MLRKASRRLLSKWRKNDSKDLHEKCSEQAPRINDAHESDDRIPLLLNTSSDSVAEDSKKEDNAQLWRPPPPPPPRACNTSCAKRKSDSVWPTQRSALPAISSQAKHSPPPSLYSIPNITGDLPSPPEHDSQTSSPSLVESRNLLWRRNGEHSELFIPILKVVKERDETDDGQVVDDMPPPAIFYAAAMRAQPLHALAEEEEEEESGDFDERFDEKARLLDYFPIPPSSTPLGSLSFVSRWSQRPTSDSWARIPEVQSSGSTDSHSSSPSSIFTTLSLDPFEDPKGDCSSLESICDTPDKADGSSVSHEDFGCQERCFDDFVPSPSSNIDNLLERNRMVQDDCLHESRLFAANVRQGALQGLPLTFLFFCSHIVKISLKAMVTDMDTPFQMQFLQRILPPRSDPLQPTPRPIRQDETTVLTSDIPSDGQDLQDDRVVLVGPIGEPELHDIERVATPFAPASTPVLVGETLSDNDSPPNYEPQPGDGETCVVAPVFHFGLVEHTATTYPTEMMEDQAQNRLLRRTISLPVVHDDVLDASDHPPVSDDAGIPGPSDPESLEDSNSDTLSMSSPERSDILDIDLELELSFVPLSRSETPGSQSTPTMVQGPPAGSIMSEAEPSRTSAIKGIDKLPIELLVEIFAHLSRIYWLEDVKLVCSLWFPSPFYTIQREVPEGRDQVFAKARRIVDSENFDEVSFVVDERPSSDSLPLNLDLLASNFPWRNLDTGLSWSRLVRLSLDCPLSLHDARTKLIDGLALRTVTFSNVFEDRGLPPMAPLRIAKVVENLETLSITSSAALTILFSNLTTPNLRRLSLQPRLAPFEFMTPLILDSTLDIPWNTLEDLSLTSSSSPPCDVDTILTKCNNLRQLSWCGDHDQFTASGRLSSSDLPCLEQITINSTARGCDDLTGAVLPEATMQSLNQGQFMSLPSMLLDPQLTFKLSNLSIDNAISLEQLRALLGALSSLQHGKFEVGIDHSITLPANDAEEQLHCGALRGLQLFTSNSLLPFWRTLVARKIRTVGLSTHDPYLDLLTDIKPFLSRYKNYTMTQINLHAYIWDFGSQ
ncbi:hypothetical protein NLJ89_g6 [Agrocybe chaxingu]|uniref:F-box domain-containing protein n=1 Tax=Agrocybe chaxingu TaxID=84603 RepID=A0A9W8TFP3_9AGAR|nr:hypothetical protein NLJ89_g6 [Agrocybe chaxingu]